MASVYAKLNAAREEFHSLELRKTGKNTFAGYQYFELGDFLIPALNVFRKHGLCGIVSFSADTATMRVVAEDDGSEIIFTSPMGSAALKGCHEVQNIGAVETYQRRYLWVAALEIVEHDALDATTGKAEPERKRAAPTEVLDRITEAQFKELSALAEKVGIDNRQFCTFYKISAASELPASKFDHAMAALRKKLPQPEKEAA